MIRGFSAIDDSSSAVPTPAAAPAKAVTNTDPRRRHSSETPEAREVRLSLEYRAALRAVSVGNYELGRKALTSLLHAIPSGPASNLLHLRYAASKNLAESCVATSDHHAALNAYMMALEDDSSDIVVWLRAADVAKQCGNISAARHALETALHQRPHHWLCFRRLSALAPFTESTRNAGSQEDAFADITKARVKRRRLDTETSDSFMDFEFTPTTLVLSEASLSALAHSISSHMALCQQNCNSRSVSSPLQIKYEYTTQLSIDAPASSDCSPVAVSASEDEAIEPKDIHIATRRSRRIADEETRHKRTDDENDNHPDRDDSSNLELLLTRLLQMSSSNNLEIPPPRLSLRMDESNIFLDRDASTHCHYSNAQGSNERENIERFLGVIENTTFEGPVDFSRAMIRWFSRSQEPIDSDTSNAISTLWSLIQKLEPTVGLDRTDLIFLAEVFLPFENVKKTPPLVVERVAKILHLMSTVESRNAVLDFEKTNVSIEENKSTENLWLRREIIRGSLCMARQQFSKARDCYQQVLELLGSLNAKVSIEVGSNLQRLLDPKKSRLSALRCLLKNRIDSIQRKVTKERTRQLFSDEDYLGVFEILGRSFLNISFEVEIPFQKWIDTHEDVARLSESCARLGDLAGCLWIEARQLAGLVSAEKSISDRDSKKDIRHLIEKRIMSLIHRCKTLPLKASSRIYSNSPNGPSGIVLDAALVEVLRILTNFALDIGLSRIKTPTLSVRRHLFPRLALTLVRLLLALRPTPDSDNLALDVSKGFVSYLLSQMPSSKTNVVLLNCYADLLKTQLNQLKMRSRITVDDFEANYSDESDIDDEESPTMPRQLKQNKWDSIKFCRREWATCVSLLYGVPNLETSGKKEEMSKLGRKNASFIARQGIPSVPIGLQVFEFYKSTLCSKSDRRFEAGKVDRMLGALQDVASSASDAHNCIVGRLSSQTIKQAVTGELTSVDNLVSTWEMAEMPRSEVDVRFTEMLYMIHLIQAVRSIRAFETDFKFVRDVLKRMGDYRVHYEKLKHAAVEIRKALTFRPHCTELWLLLSFVYTEYCVGLVDNMVLLESDQKGRKVFLRSFTKELSKAKRCIHLAREIATGDWGRPFGAFERRTVSQIEMWLPSDRSLSEGGRQLLSSCSIASIVLLRNEALVAFSSEPRSTSLLTESLREYQKSRELLQTLCNEFPARSPSLLSMINFRISRLKRKVGGYDELECLQDAELGFQSAAQFNQVHHIYTLFSLQLKTLIAYRCGKTNSTLLDHLEDTRVAIDGNLAECRASDPVSTNPRTEEERVRTLACRAIGVLRKCRQKESVEFGEYYFKSVYAVARAQLEIFGDASEAAQEMSQIFQRSRDMLKCKIWNYRYVHCGCLPLIESERKFVYWKCKLVRFYSKVLLQTGDQDKMFLLLAFLSRKLQEGETFDHGETLETVAENAAAMIDHNREAQTVSICENSMNILWRILRVPMLESAQREKMKTRLASIYEQYKQRVREGESQVPTVIDEVLGATKFCLMKWG